MQREVWLREGLSGLQTSSAGLVSSGRQGVLCLKHRCLQRLMGAVGACAGRPFDELSLPSLSLSKVSSTSAQPPLALLEERVRAQNGRQLGCALITAAVCWRKLCGSMPHCVDELLLLPPEQLYI